MNKEDSKVNLEHLFNAVTENAALAKKIFQKLNQGNEQHIQHKTIWLPFQKNTFGTPDANARFYRPDNGHYFYFVFYY
jgi:hypothetical protein